MSSKVELEELINNDPLSQRIVDLKVGEKLPIKDPKAIQKIKELYYKQRVFKRPLLTESKDSSKTFSTETKEQEKERPLI